MELSQEACRDYAALRRAVQPPRPLLRNALIAFLVGGIIVTIGQVFLAYFVELGMSPRDAASPTAAVMILLGAVLTGIGIYDEVVRFGGMGGALPISGFANAMVSPAMEYKREGAVLGVGARMFTVAGPVIVYGLVTAILVAIILMGFDQL